MRCTYRYPDDMQCTINAPAGKKMCTDHRLLVQMAKDKKKNDAKRDWSKRPSRAKPRVEKVDEKPKETKTVTHVYFDHTAPWRCSKKSCVDCKDKLSYDDYMREKVKK